VHTVGAVANGGADLAPIKLGEIVMSIQADKSIKLHVALLAAPKNADIARTAATALGNCDNCGCRVKPRDVTLIETHSLRIVCARCGWVRLEIGVR
jgi:hypothetical protein